MTSIAAIEAPPERRGDADAAAWSQWLALDVALPPDPDEESEAGIQEPPAVTARLGRYVPSLYTVAQFPDSAARWAAYVDPCLETGPVLASLDIGSLSPTGRVDLLVAVNRQIESLRAREYEVLAEMKARADERADVVDPTGKLWIVEDVRAALRVGGDEAQGKLVYAQVLTRELPATHALLQHGRITGRQAQRLAEDCTGLTAPQRAALEERVLARAPQQSFAQFRRSLNTALAAVAPKTQEQTRASDLAERRIVIDHRPNGMSTFWTLAPTEGIQSLFAAVQALATRSAAEAGPADDRTAEQRRVDALVELGAWALAQPDLPRAHGLRPHINVTMTMQTLLGLSDQPADLDGVGPIPAAVARQLAHDPTGTWRRMITDPANGRCLDYGRGVYKPPPPLAEHIIARDRTCVFPTCSRKARTSHIDHQRDWDRGGRTADTNLGALCPRHHRTKHIAGWTVAQTSSGHRWTSPTGHRYLSQPDPYPTDTGPPPDTDSPPDTDPPLDAGLPPDTHPPTDADPPPDTDRPPNADPPPF